jgi:RNA polymerase sigma factor (sigma-70 family)
MAVKNSDRQFINPQMGRFTSTQWSLVLAAAGRSTPASENALGALCAAYWPPLYAYIRRRGYEVSEAQDLTQAFFVRLLEKNYLGDADREKGKFRSFLLASLNHFLANEWDRKQAQKRGGGVTIVPLEMDSAEGYYRTDRADLLTPEKLFERRWALTVIELALKRLEEEFTDKGKARLFNCVKPFLTGADGELTYHQIGAELGMSEGAVKAAVHRMRRRFRELMRAEIAQTIMRPDQPDAIDAELRSLLAALSP